MRYDYNLFQAYGKLGRCDVQTGQSAMAKAVLAGLPRASTECSKTTPQADQIARAIAEAEANLAVASETK